MGYTNADGARQKFTQKERDNETGLDYFINRYYSSVQGRFTSVDPLMASCRAFRPQTWNRYAYVLNNPLRLIDPNGLQGEEPEHRHKHDLHDLVAQGDPEIDPDNIDPNDEVRRELEDSFEPVEPTEEVEPLEHKSAYWDPEADLPGVVYRGDTRTPEDISKNAFIAKGNNMDLLQHANQNPPDSGFVSTTTNIETAKEAAGENGWIYIIVPPPNAINVNNALGENSPHPEEEEIAVPGEIPLRSVYGAVSMKGIRLFWFNPLGPSIPLPPGPPTHAP